MYPDPDPNPGIRTSISFFSDFKDGQKKFSHIFFL